MMGRREVLGGLAGIASMATLAGCTTLSPGGTGANPLPDYHRYVAGEGSEDEGVFFATIDVDTLREVEDGALQENLPQGSTPAVEGGVDEPDPLVAYPVVGLFVAALGVSFGLFPYGFAGQIAEGFSGTALEAGTETPGTGGGGTETAEDATRVDTMVMQSTAIVLEGNFDGAALADAARGFTHDGEYGEYEVYVGGAGESMLDTSDLAFAVDGETLVALVADDRDDPRADLEGALDVATGDGERLSDDADAEWALRTAGHGFSVLGGWGLDPTEVQPTDEVPDRDVGVESVLDGADGLVSSLAFDGGERATTATVAAVYPEGETPTREQLEADLGATATEREVEVDGTRVSVTATWSVETTTDA